MNLGLVNEYKYVRFCIIYACVNFRDWDQARNWPIYIYEHVPSASLPLSHSLSLSDIEDTYVKLVSESLWWNSLAL